MSPGARPGRRRGRSERPRGARPDNGDISTASLLDRETGRGRTAGERGFDRGRMSVPGGTGGRSATRGRPGRGVGLTLAVREDDVRGGTAGLRTPGPRCGPARLPRVEPSRERSRASCAAARRRPPPDVVPVLLTSLDEERDDVNDHASEAADGSISAARARTAGWTMARGLVAPGVGKTIWPSGPGSTDRRRSARRYRSAAPPRPAPAYRAPPPRGPARRRRSPPPRAAPARSATRLLPDAIPPVRPTRITGSRLRDLLACGIGSRIAGVSQPAPVSLARSRACCSARSSVGTWASCAP